MTVGRIPSIEGGIQPTIVTTKGDLIAATAASNPARLGVGANDTILTADSSTATGLKWATPTTGTWTTFTPTFNNLTIGNGTLTGKYLNANKTLIFAVKLIFGSTTSMGTNPSLNLPVAAASTAAAQSGIYSLNFQDHAIGTFIGAVQALNITTTYIPFGGSNAGSSYVTYDGATATIPFTWNTNDSLYFGGMYEVA